MKRTNMASPAPMVFAGLGQFYVKTVQKRLNAENHRKVSRVSRESHGPLGSRRDVQMASLNAKNQRKVGHARHRA